MSIATLTVAISSALVAFLQYSAARRAYSAQSRAFVLSNSLQLITYGGKGPNDEETPRWLINPVIENLGNTPTSELKFSMDIVIGNFVTSETFDQRNPYRLSFAQGVIGPRSQMASGMMIIGPLNLTPLSGRKAPVGALGVIKYKDVFGDRHLTEYCYSAIIPPLDAKDFPRGQPIRINGAYCERHNCADAECGPDWEKRASEQ
ncbi:MULTISPECIES: hypothetical protein [unclassified Bradyrhizobium]|uniref:hypothetical protein n=1 Tax=unclassified Bradyrhizobium TaxID=2631580 RepID=UPI0028E21DE4|nr:MULTISPECIES: hypothetical protein [unclassified Bradyrhizobium]